jgi:predicted metal-binding protein
VLRSTVLHGRLVRDVTQTHMKKYLEKAKRRGVSWVKIIHPKNVVIAEWVRLKCQYGCGRYGTCLTCPPFSPTPEYTRKMLKPYSKALIMIYDIPPQPQERRIRQKMRKGIASLEREMFLDGYYKAFGMASGPCNLCKICDITQPCKFEDLARPSMEACGIDVYATLANVGYKLEVVKSYDQICHYCGLILID